MRVPKTGMGLVNILTWDHKLLGRSEEGATPPISSKEGLQPGWQIIRTIRGSGWQMLPEIGVRAALRFRP